MTSIPTTAASALPVRQPAQPAAAPAGGLPMVAIDPIKLLKKYKWLLAAAAFAGILVGFVAHIVCLQLYPLYRPYAIFECYSPQTDILKPTGSADGQAQEELERFMATQVKIMTSDQILRKAIEDPNFIREAGPWAAQFTKNGKIDVSTAVAKLRKQVSARALSQTRLLELSMTWTNAAAATGIVKLVRETYMEQLNRRAQTESGPQQDAIARSIAETDAAITSEQAKRRTIIEENGVDTLERQNSESAQSLSLVNQSLAEIQLAKKQIEVQLKSMRDEQLNPKSGITYSPQMIELADRDPLLTNIRATISALEADLLTLRAQGFTDEHRDVRNTKAAIEGYKQKESVVTAEVLQKTFDAMLDQFDKGMQTLDAQEKSLKEEADTYKKRLSDLARITAQIRDIDLNIERMIQSRSENTTALNSIKNLARLPSVIRVVDISRERVPEELAFPKLAIMLPAGMLLITGLVGGLVVLREVLDQRVKGPSDVALIPRARVLGIVPDAAEDPAGAGAVETAFRDRSKGVVAESFRQLRGSLLKRLDQAGHKTLLVLAGLPGSGSTTTVVNLAFAAAATDRKVLIIDANFRRPAVHRTFGIQETPGLADVLAGRTQLAQAVQTTAEPRLDVLTAGSRADRVFERLSTDGMRQLLEDVKSRYDLILLDCAPAVVAGDGFAIANRCDASMLVVKAFSEKRGMVARLRNELSDTHSEFMGVLVNAVKSAAGGYLRGNIKASHEYQNEVSGGQARADKASAKADKASRKAVAKAAKDEKTEQV
ncbi:MAG: polysaccharide biosynthesis tyrosine autokinase [Phycisphaerales bacterium]|nr:polysaccharide biosynthesis tyrosine autokinase [Phycisphaerales bacterium]